MLIFVGSTALVAGLTCTAPSPGAVQLSPHIWWGESFLSDAAADRIRAKLPAPTAGDGWGKCSSAVQQAERSCYKIDVREDAELRELLNERFASTPFSIDTANLDFLPATRSIPGAPEYPIHVDHAGQEWRGKGAVPQYTAVMYLSTMKKPNSGVTVFDRASTSIQPAKGDLLIFENNDGSSIHAAHHGDVSHRITPVAEDEEDERIMVQLIMQSNADSSALTAYGHGSGNAPSLPVAQGLGDPHFFTAHGDRFDYRGEHDQIYNLLSHTNVSVNARFKHADYKRPGPAHQLVHGSFMRDLYATVRTNTSRLLQVEFGSSRSALVRFGERGSAVSAIHMGAEKHIDDVTFKLDERTLIITTPEWIVKGTSKVTPGIVNATKCTDGKCAIHVSVSPRFDTSRTRVAPHGLIGQAYDGDDVGVLGAVDDYKGAEFTTSAMGEGAIEGKGEDYEVASKYDTEFAFSRFGKTFAKPRDASKLTGEKVKLNNTKLLAEVTDAL